MASVVMLALGWALPVWAHHSFGATFDEAKVVNLTGVVTGVKYTNPHSHLFMDVKEESGATVAWSFEGYPPVTLYRTGFDPKVTLKVGDTVGVFGWRARDGSPFALARELTLANGKKLFFGPPAGTGEGAAVAPGTN